MTSTFIIKYFAQHRVSKGPLRSGFDTLAEAKAQAEWLADTYGGTAKAASNTLDAEVFKYSTKRGWH